MAKKSDFSQQKNQGSVSHDFKIAIVVLLFALTLLRLTLLIYFPTTEIISDKIFLFLVLFIVSYLWIQDLIDFHKLLAVNRDLLHAQEQLKQAEIDTIASLVKAVEAKDFYTLGHSERVTDISLAIAEELNLTRDSKMIISRAGILHDIGKIAISEQILNKKETLTDEEWRIIKYHPENAVRILSPLKFLASEREVILSHHERCNGKGYPRGLSGENICLEARIMAVADSFDAMNSERSYREPLNRDAIIEQLIQGRVSQYSQEIVDTFLILLKKNPQLWER